MDKLAGFFGVTILLGALVASGCSYGPRTTVHVEGDLIFDTTIGTKVEERRPPVPSPEMSDRDDITPADLDLCCEHATGIAHRRQHGYVLCYGEEVQCF